ncbi:SoxH protein, homolog [plant metagenome]|uniref:SoxH protein, homolog n=1 Tax=plant metagenome TaxID=1297885 RepID=A0A484UQT1_9ZZZZ
MNPDEQKLVYPWNDLQPEPGRALEAAEGVYWVRMPLPFVLDHVNVWLIRDEYEGRQGWAIVDCGIAREEIRALWEDVFTHCLHGLPVLRVIVTHMHPDHVGLAQWLCAKWKVPLFMSMTDYVLARLWSQEGPQGEGTGGDTAVAHFGRHGLVDPEAQAQIRERSGYYRGLVPGMPSTFHRLVHGDWLRIGRHDWRLIVGYGHAPEHISLYSPALQTLISGDMVLPRISTNVSVFDSEPDADPLRLYLSSLAGYDDVPEDTLVLPSHGRPFKGLHERIAQQRHHHAERLQEVMEACDVQPCSAADIVPVLFKRKLDLHQLTFAMGEALAHLQALFHEGRLVRETGSDGIVRYRVRPPAQLPEESEAEAVQG